MNELQQQIMKLKKEKNAVILAHYYVIDEVQEIADYVGDSYYLAKIATKVESDTIIFCGVSFMGESAKILNPNKTILMPDLQADCPMAHMADVDRINAIKAEWEDLAVVCYINSTAELKEVSDVCVTSSNAMKIVKALPNKNILFIPDENLGRYIAEKVPEKHFIFNDGYCHVHAELTKDKILAAKKLHPEAKLLMHPECKMEALQEADFIGSTSEIISYAASCDAKEFLIATETGVFYELERQNPDKHFYPIWEKQICPNMKRVSLKKVLDCLTENCNQVEVSDSLRENANQPLNRMLELAQ